jgi:hypothetical protein
VTEEEEETVTEMEEELFVNVASPSVRVPPL